jgi:hypothetical protein
LRDDCPHFEEKIHAFMSDEISAETQAILKRLAKISAESEAAHQRIEAFSGRLVNEWRCRGCGKEGVLKTCSERGLWFMPWMGRQGF